jgi:hypothetical protein
MGRGRVRRRWRARHRDVDVPAAARRGNVAAAR